MAKRVGGRGSAPDPAGGAYDDPPDPLVGWGGDTPPQTSASSAPSALRFSRLWRSILGAFGALNFTSSALNFGVPIVVNLRNDHWACVLIPLTNHDNQYYRPIVLLLYCTNLYSLRIPANARQRKTHNVTHTPVLKTEHINQWP